MNLEIYLPYSFEIYNLHNDIQKNNKVLDYVKMIIIIENKIGIHIDVLDRLNLFDTTISYDELDNKINFLDNIITNLVKKYKNHDASDTFSNKNIYNDIMFCYRYIIDYKMYYEDNEYNNKNIRSRL